MIVTRYLFLGLACSLALAGSPVWAADVDQIAGQSAQPSPAQPAPAWFSPFAGVDVAPGSWFAYGGGGAALNGDMSKDGFLLMGLGGYGQFKYGNSAVPGGTVNGSISITDALVGYQTFGSFYRLAGYAGLDYMHFTYSPPDPTVTVKGNRAGFKVMGQFETTSATPYYLSAMASYSTAFDSYWAQIRPGYRVAPFIFGPEATFQGNKGGNSHRIGAFASFNNQINNTLFGVTLSGGYSFVGNNTSNVAGGTRNGVYGAVSGWMLF